MGCSVNLFLLIFLLLMPMKQPTIPASIAIMDLCPVGGDPAISADNLVSCWGPGGKLLYTYTIIGEIVLP